MKYCESDNKFSLPLNRRYYKTQDELISAFEDLQMEVDDAMESAAAQQRLLRLARVMAKASLAANLVGWMYMSGITL